MSTADTGKPLPQALPPNAATRKPSWDVPVGATDTHFHVFGPKHKFPYSPRRRYDAPDAPFEQWQRTAAVCGITRGVAVTGSVHNHDNAPMLDALARSSGSLKGVAKINRDMSKQELLRMRDLGVVGARFSMLEDRQGTIDEIKWAAPVLETLGWSMELHVSPESLLANEKTIRSLSVPVVFDHMANLRPSDGLEHPAMQLLLDLLGSGEYWTKIAAVHKLSTIMLADAPPGQLPYTDMVERARLLVERVPDRLLWGTDYPHGNIYDAERIPNDGDLIDLVPRYATTPEARQKLLVDNPTKCYWTGRNG